MPSTSKKQHNFMEAIAHSPSFAKKVGVPQSVGKEFSTADKGKKFSKGGDPMASKMNPAFAAMIEKKKAGAAGKKPAGKPFAKGGGIESKGKTKGKMIAMPKGKPLGMKSGGKC